MEMEEVRKRKGEAEEAIKNIILKFQEDTDTKIINIELIRQYIDTWVRGYTVAHNYGKITDIKASVQFR